MASTPFAQHASTGPAPAQPGTPYPPGGSLQPPPPSPQPQSTRRPRLWPVAVVAVLLVIGAIAATAAITYAIARSTTPATSGAEPPLTVAPGQQYRADEQATAKQHLCSVFDASTKG